MFDSPNSRLYMNQGEIVYTWYAYFFFINLYIFPNKTENFVYI